MHVLSMLFLFHKVLCNSSYHSKSLLSYAGLTCAKPFITAQDVCRVSNTQFRIISLCFVRKLAESWKYSVLSILIPHD
jgi:hypothetical protein